MNLADTLLKLERVTNWKAGDRVVSETAAVINPNNPISRTRFIQFRSRQKRFWLWCKWCHDTYVKVPARCLHRVPEHLPFEQACLTEPCCVAYNAVVNNSQNKTRRPSNCSWPRHNRNSMCSNRKTYAAPKLQLRA